MTDQRSMVKAGDVLGEYVLVARIGGGGFGEVWKARHFHWKDRVAAVKVPHSAENLKSLRREGMIGGDLARLESPHIARTLGMNLLSDPPYFLMEYVDGPSLRDRLNAEQRVPLPIAVTITEQVLAALELAHGHGVVHRDVKPGNILLGPGGVVKLTDFGVGQVHQALGASRMLTGSLRTSHADGIAGTYEYMSPEQKRGRDVDASTDLYALGVTFFEMLTGELPEPGDKPTDLAPDLPVGVDRFFARAYVRRSRRFSNAAEMRLALAEIASASGTRTAEKSRDEQRRLLREALGVPPGINVGQRAERLALEAAEAAEARRRGQGASASGDPAASKADAVAHTDHSASKLAEAAYAYPQRSEAPSGPALDSLLNPGAYRRLVAEVREHPANHRLATRLGIAELARGNLREAEAHFRRVAELKPGSAEAHANLGLVLSRLGKLPDAEQEYRKAVHLAPSSARLHTNLGAVLFKMGREDDAREEHALALRLDPGNSAALYNLVVPE